MAKLIETQNVNREYGFDGTNAIIEKNGNRILIMDGFGGNDIEGQCVRWKHGMAIKIKADDTLSGLQAGKWNDITTHWEAMVAGYDTERPVLDWSGFAIANIAKSLGI